MNKNTVLILLSISILVGIITRFYKLGSAPAGLYLDEAAQGYNAFSILKTGKDEFGKAFPIVFRSFTDFKTPVYIYLIVPLIPIFGLTKYTVRFPSFFFSILTIPLLYLLIKNLLKFKKHDVKGKQIITENRKLTFRQELIAIISSLLISISPWHILFGRTNFECNVALFFFLCGTYFFYKGLSNPKNLIYSALFWSIAIPAYHAQRIATPLMMIILLIKFRKILFSKTHLKYVFIGSLLGLLMLIPTLIVATTPGFLARATSLNIFSNTNHIPSGYLDNYIGPFSSLINSSWFLSTKEFLALYFSYFSPRNMFILGDYGLRSSFPKISTFFLWQFPFYIIGLYKLVKTKIFAEFRYFILSLLLVSPIPAALTSDPYTSIRSLQMVIPLIVIIALGITETYLFLLGFIKKLKSNYIFLFNYTTILSFAGIILYSVLKLYSSIIILNEYYRADEWNYGFEQMADDIKKFDPNLPIIVDNARTEPYSQLLFFLKYDPAIYQADNFEVNQSEYYTNMKRDKTKRIGQITTRAIEWKTDLKKEQYLIGDALSISDEQIKIHNLILVEKIKYPDGSIAFVLTKTPKL